MTPSFASLKQQRHWSTSSLSLVFSFGSILLGVILFLRYNPSQPTASEVQIMAETTNTPAAPEIKYELVLQEESPKVLRYAAKEKQSDGSYHVVTVHRWLTLLTTTYQDLISPFNDILLTHATDMKAFFFETKGVGFTSSRTVNFEFALVESSYLYQFADAQQDPSDFGDLLKCGNEVGCVFANLGGDSILIAPAKADSTANNVYGHLAAFLRRASPTQVQAFWKLTLETVLQTLQSTPDKTYWFSTDGTGVKWLHMRIDPWPKYYDYQPFAAVDNS